MNSDLVERHPLKEKRRANKPLLERKRRARINDSLRDLKSLVLSSLNKDVNKFSKMEKVDVLDMTVQYLKGQRREQRKDDAVSVYKAGYSECTNEMIRFVMQMPSVEPASRNKLLQFLAQNVQSLESPPPSPTPSIHSTLSGSNTSGYASSGYASGSDTSRSPVPSPSNHLPSPQQPPHHQHTTQQQSPQRYIYDPPTYAQQPTACRIEPARPVPKHAPVRIAPRTALPQHTPYYQPQQPQLPQQTQQQSPPPPTSRRILMDPSPAAAPKMNTSPMPSLHFQGGVIARAAPKQNTFPATAPSTEHKSPVAPSAKLKFEQSSSDSVWRPW